MKFKKFMSLFVVVAIIFVSLSMNVFAASSYEHVVNAHDYDTFPPFDLYSFSGYCDTDAFIYSFMTLGTPPYAGYTATCRAEAVIVVFYTDGTFDILSDRTGEFVVSSFGDGRHAYAEIAFDTSKIVDRFSYQHYYIVDDVCVKRHTYNYNYEA